MIGGPHGPRCGKVRARRGRFAPYGSPALRSTRATTSRAMERGAKRHWERKREGQGQNPIDRVAPSTAIPAGIA
jgi:hypothetical protein